MDSDTTRTSLLSRVRDASDADAWREFESRYGRLILHYARARGLNWHDAEDVRQQVLMDLSRSLRGFHYDPARGRFRDYLGRIVRNVISRLRARPNPAAPLQGIDEGLSIPAGREAEQDELWEREWLDHHYRRALDAVCATFEPGSVQMFQRILDGQSVAEVAAAYGISTQAVHKVKQRIRDRLKELVAAQVREEDQPDEPLASKPS